MTNADGWRSITATQREGWASLGDQIVRTNSLGAYYTLSGFAAYCSVNNERLAAGDAVLAEAPLLDLPGPVASVTPTATIATFSVAYTVTPLAANTRAFVYASPMRSAGRTYESDYRLISVTAAAAASPANIFAAYSARFGLPVVGAKIFVSVQTYLAGFKSSAIQTSLIVS